MLRTTTLLLATLVASCQAPSTSAMRDASGMLLPGSPCPHFQVLDTEGHLVTDADLAGKRTILWFYPKAATPGWTLEGNGFRDRIQDFQAIDTLVFGVSLDTVADNKAFREQSGYSFPLLSDTDRSMSLAFGAVSSASAKYARRLTFVIGADGLIEQSIETSDPAGQAAALLSGPP